MKTWFYALTIEICLIKQFDNHWKLFETLDFNTTQGFLFLFFIPVFPDYFNEFIYEIMK